MIAHPQLLILDEPTLGLDLASTKIMTNMLKQLASHGIGILVTTHQLDFAQKVADKILLINHGQLVFSGNVKASLARLNQRTVFEVQFSRKITTAEKEKVMSYCKVTAKNENMYYLSIKKTQYLSMVLSLLSKLPVETIETKTRDLSDIFEYYMG